MTGKFITIEGSEGSGKSTIIKAISEHLLATGKEVVVTREPGGTEIGEQIRNILLNKKNQKIHPETELLLMFAARAQHWQSLIKPKLKQGLWVVCDRFVDSSFAYQGGGRGIAISRIAQLEHWLLGDFKADLTIFLDLDPKLGMQRAKKRGSLDRFEIEAIEFFNRVRTVYLARAKSQKNIHVIDASASLEQVKSNAISLLQKL